MNAADPTTQAPRFPLMTSAGLIVVAAGVLDLVALGGLRLAGMANHGPSVNWALAICAGFGVLGLLPAAILDRKMPFGAAYGFMLGMLIRMIGCAAVTFAVLKRDLALPAFTMWMGGAYLAVLLVETSILRWHLRRIPTPAAGAPATAADMEVDGCST